MRQKHRFQIVGVGMVLLALALWVFFLEIRKRGFQWGVLYQTFGQLDWRWLATSCVFIYITYYVRALRWAVLIRPLKPRASIVGLLSATIIGYTALTILGRPGEFVRPYLIANKENLPLSSQLAVWLLERIFDLLTALGIFAFALSQVNASEVATGPALSWVLRMGGLMVGILCTICVAVLVVIRFFSETMRQRLLDSLGFLSEHHMPAAERLVNAFVQGIASTKSWLATLEIVVLTLLEWALVAAGYICLVHAFRSSLRLDWIDIVIFMGFVSFGSAVQIPGIGGGVQLVSIVVLTQIFGVPLEIATAFALLIWLVTFVVVLPAGTVLALREGITWANLKQAGQEAMP